MLYTAQTVEKDAKATKPADPTKNGYTFKGWKISAADEAFYDFSTSITADTTLIAIWAQNFTVTFDSAEGSAVNTQTVEDGNKATKPVDPTREGYTFLGWKINAADEKYYDFDSAVTKNITLTAVWSEGTAEKFTVTFNADNGSESVTQEVAKDSTVTKPEDPTKEGFTFKGWQLSGADYDFTTPVTADITLVAVWEEVKTEYSVTFDANGGTGTMEAAKTEAGEFTLPACTFTAPEGKKFAGWLVDGDTAPKAAGTTITVSADTTVKAAWEDKAADEFTVTFDTDGGSAVSAATVKSGEKVSKPADPTKEGFTFKGWQLDGKDYSFDSAVTGDITLKAVWEEDKSEKFTVTFNSDGGSAVSAATVKSGEKVSKPADPIREGYKFKGWQLDGKDYDFAAAVTGDITLKAVWEEIKEEKFTVTFDSDGGTKITAQEVKAGGTVNKPADPVRKGYTFGGWKTSDGSAYNFDSAVTENLTLKASWTKSEYTVTYHFDTNTSSDTLTYGSSVKKVSDVFTASSGKTLVGWYKDSGCTTLFSGTVTENLDLYAREIVSSTPGGVVVGDGETAKPIDEAINALPTSGDVDIVLTGNIAPVKKIDFPKSGSSDITIEGNGNTFAFDGNAAFKPKADQSLTLSDITIKSEKSGKAKNITITAAKGANDEGQGLVLDNVALEGKKATISATKSDLTICDLDTTKVAGDVNVKGSKKTTATVDGEAEITKLSGFGTLKVEGTLVIEKSLSVDTLELEGTLVVASGAKVSVKNISGSGTIVFKSGFKSFTISKGASGDITVDTDALNNGDKVFKTKKAPLSVFDPTDGTLAQEKSYIVVKK